jgi:hypothetical protein
MFKTKHILDTYKTEKSQEVDMKFLREETLFQNLLILLGDTYSGLTL